MWEQLHHELLRRLHRAERIKWSWACMDSASIAAKKGAATGPNSTERRKAGTKRHLLTARDGLPLAELLDAVVPV